MASYPECRNVDLTRPIPRLLHDIISPESEPSGITFGM
jgi:hypothetical protein